MHGICKLCHFKDSKFEKCTQFSKMVGFGAADGTGRFQPVLSPIGDGTGRKSPVRHHQDHFQKYDYALGFLFALSTPTDDYSNPYVINIRTPGGIIKYTLIFHPNPC